MQRVYLDQIPRDEALRRLLARAVLPKKREKVAVTKALGRVTSDTVFANRSMPAYQAAAMDGIAVRAETTFGTSDQEPRILNLGDDYLPVDTGDPIPEGFDAVIKIEDIQPITEQSVEILSPATPWQHVRPVGEDVVAREIILPAFHLLQPPDLGALLAGGITEVDVLVRPRVVIIPTGEELVLPEKEVKTGDIPEFNSTVIAGYLTQWGAEPEVFPIVDDQLQEITDRLKDAMTRADLVIINAGSSAGREDFTSQAIAEVGEVLVHGVATRPGKPTILGVAGMKPIFGLPGYPISAYLALEWFVRPVLFQYFNLIEPKRPVITGQAGRRIVSEVGVEEFIRVNVGFINNRYVVNPLNRGAGVTMSLVRADGLLVIPANSLGVEEGEEVSVEIYKAEKEIKETLVATGSHDMALDLLGTALKQIHPGLTLSSSHVGSIGGIIAIGKGQAHIAGVHLFDPATGEYNIPYLNKFLPGKAVVLVNLTYRTQGFIVGPGNPLQINGVTDLLREGVRFINRQRGAGTRLLFDYLLAKAGINPTQIYGYQREEYTHLNVAAAVAAGTADVGLGILSAALAYGLNFLPVGEERYDLLMTEEFYRSPLGRELIQAIATKQFQNAVGALEGYNMRDAGKVIFRS